MNVADLSCHLLSLGCALLLRSHPCIRVEPIAAWGAACQDHAVLLSLETWRVCMARELVLAPDARGQCIIQAFVKKVDLAEKVDPKLAMLHTDMESTLVHDASSAHTC